MTDQIDQTAGQARHYVRRSKRYRPTIGDRISSSGPFLFVGVGVAGILVLSLLLIGVDIALSNDRVHPGVSLSGIPVGGKRPDEAATELKRVLPGRTSQPINLEAEGESWEMSPQDMGATYDYEALVRAAMRVGRGESPVLERVRAWFGGVDVPIAATIEDGGFAKAVSVVEDGMGSPARDADVVIEGTTVRVTPSAKGTAILKKKLRADIERAIPSSDRTVRVRTAVANPRVTDIGAERAAETAEHMLSGSVKVTYEEDSWSYEPEQIATWIDFRQVDSEIAGSPKMLEPVVTAEELKESLEPQLGDLGKPAKDARFRTRGGDVTIEPSQDGLAPNYAALGDSLTAALVRGGEARTAPLRMTRREPELTTEKARGMGIKERFGTYTTEYSSGNAPRVNNIHTLAEAIDGTLVPPGGTFSFNEAVGERTAEKGYQEAPAIINGELVPQLGGGICQVGTTLFNAVFESGLPVAERHNHSFYISHYPKGRDATVSWDGPDFKFRNDTKQYVLVAAGAGSSSVTISIYGTDPGYEVEARVGDWYGVRSPSTRTLKDPKLEKGAKVVEESGQSGRSIKVTRIVTKDGKVIREDTFTSVYRPVAQVVRVGTKPPASTEPTATPKSGAKP